MATQKHPNFKDGNPNMIDRWILSRLSLMVRTVNDSFAHRNLHVVTMAVKQFFYSEFCDWYLVGINYFEDQRKD